MTNTLALREKLAVDKLALPFFIIGIVTTIFDSVASYISIIKNNIAEEGNVILNSIFNLLIENFGASSELAFGVTMGIRAIFGIALLTLLFGIFKKSARPKDKTKAAIGLVIVGVILTLLAIYHIVGMTIFG